jgi:hypothetical protein
MNPSDLVSVSLFKKIVSEYLPDYNLVDNDVVFKTLQRSLSYNSSDSALILNQELQQNKINFNEVLEEFTSNLAEHYIQNPNHLDPIITQLLNSNFLEFTSKVEELIELQIGIQRNERKRLKEILIQQDEFQFQEDLKVAFLNIERKEKKKILQEIEELEIIRPTGTEYSAYSVNPGQENIPHSIKPVAVKNQIPWKFVIRVAAVLILVLVPVGISVLFFGDNETSVGGKSPKPKNGKSIIYAETGDLTELKRINIPLPKVDNLVSKIENNEPSFGFAKQEDKVAISVIFTGDQINYLGEKITILEQKINELKTKNIKDKEETLKSLIDVSTYCKSEKQILESKEFTYQFDKKTFNLKIFTNKKIDPENLKVYSLKEDDSTINYFLKIKDNYYQLSVKSGQLEIFKKNEIIEELDSI